MSYYPFNSDDSNKFKTDFTKKERFVDTKDKNYYCDTPGFWQYEKKWDVIDAETNLKTPGVGTKQKTKVEMTQQLHPNNYQVSVSNVIKTEKDEKFYFTGYETGPGRGFGNLSISNDMRVGNYTRKDKDYKENRESKIIDRWQFIDNRFQNPNHLILSIPRGGDSTRKNNQDLTKDDFINNHPKEFEFRY